MRSRFLNVNCLQHRQKKRIRQAYWAVGIRNANLISSKYYAIMEKVKRGGTMTKTLHIDVEDERATSERFIRTWKRAEAGEQIESEHRLCFESLELLLKALTAARWHLLKMLRSNGPLSIRGLAKRLERNYKNVYEDVTRLRQVGLIEKTADGRIEFPWEFVEAHLHLAA